MCAFIIVSHTHKDGRLAAKLQENSRYRGSRKNAYDVAISTKVVQSTVHRIYSPIGLQWLCHISITRGQTWRLLVTASPRPTHFMTYCIARISCSVGLRVWMRHEPFSCAPNSDARLVEMGRKEDAYEGWSNVDMFAMIAITRS